LVVLLNGYAHAGMIIHVCEQEVWRYGASRVVSPVGRYGSYHGRHKATVAFAGPTAWDSLSDPGRTCPNVTETDFRRLIDCESFLTKLIDLFIYL